MHHDKLKTCESRQLPKWLITYHRKLSGEPADRDSDSTPVCVVAEPLGATGSGLSPGDPGSKQKTRVEPKPAERVGPYMGTRKRVRERLSKPNKPSTPKRPKATKGGKSKQYCLCLQTKPKGLMVQCDSCRDWFHPGCVGISEAYAKSVPQYTCPECSPVSVSSH